MSLIKAGFCSKLTDEFDKRMKMLNDADKQLNTKLRALQKFLDSVNQWSPHWAANVLKKNIAKGLSGLIPNLSQFDELADLANACLFTKGDSQLSHPSTLARQLKSNVQSNASRVLDAMADLGNGIIPEFNAAKLIDELKKQVGVSGVHLITPQAKQVLGCMSAICGTNITSRALQLQSFLSKYNMSLTGEINVKALLASQGIKPDLATNINKCSKQIDGVMSGIDKSFEQGVARVKRLVPDLDDIE